MAAKLIVQDAEDGVVSVEENPAGRRENREMEMVVIHQSSGPDRSRASTDLPGRAQ